MDRERILIQVKNRQDRHLLEDWLAPAYDIISAHTNELIEERFDLAVVDGPSLKQFQSKIRARRKAEEPVLLPFLLVASFAREQHADPASGKARRRFDRAAHG